jgi:hypothetical protein
MSVKIKQKQFMKEKKTYKVKIETPATITNVYFVQAESEDEAESLVLSSSISQLKPDEQIIVSDNVNYIITDEMIV